MTMYYIRNIRVLVCVLEDTRGKHICLWIAVSVHFAIAHFVCIPHLQFLCAFRLVTSTAFPSIGRKTRLPPLLTASCSPVPREHSSLSLFPHVATRKQTTKQNRNSIVDAKPHPQPPYQALAWSYRYIVSGVMPRTFPSMELSPRE